MVLVQVLVASFFVQLLAFNPLLIQQIIDAVISQGNVSSLNVLGTLLVGMSLAQAYYHHCEHISCGYNKQNRYQFSSSIIDHLLRLPLGYSDRPVGEVSSRINDLKDQKIFNRDSVNSYLGCCLPVIYIK